MTGRMQFQLALETQPRDYDLYFIFNSFTTVDKVFQDIDVSWMSAR